MPNYEYMADDGRIIEHYRLASDAHDVGEIAQIPDPDAPGQMVAATRILSLPQVRGENWKPYVSERLPRNLAGVPCTPSGKPIITSRAQERNIMAQHGYERE